MDSKERVTAAINREPVDQVPLGFYVVDYDTIERVIGRRTFVRRKIDAQIALWEGRRDEVVESYKKDTVEFYRKIDCCDIVCFKECPRVPPADYEPLDPRKVDEDTWQTRDGRVWRASHESNMLTCIHDPHEGEAREYTVDMFEGPLEVKPPDPSEFECQDYLIEQLGAERYIMGRSGGIVALVKLGGQEQGYMNYLLIPEVVKAATRRRVAEQNAMDEYAMRPGQHGVLMEHDMASTKGPMISPAMFREFCFPAMRERVQRVRSLGMQVTLHNCGNNWAILDQMAEAGVMCYQSLQTFADMEIGKLKEAWGHTMAFWGGVSLECLVQGEPDDVRRNVREAMERGAPGGGFILGPSHSIAMGTKYDNFMAMLDEYNRLKDAF